MEKKRDNKVLAWFMDAMHEGILDPMEPDMSVLPDKVLKELTCDLIDGEYIPKQSLVDAALFMLLMAKGFEMEQKQPGASRNGIIIRASQIQQAVYQLSILTAFEELRRAGLVKYETYGKWYEEDAGIQISDVKFGYHPPSQRRGFPAE